MFQKTIKFISSLKLSVVLFLLFIAVCIFGSLPDMGAVFHSVFFYIFVVVFLINLLSCAITRLYAKLKSPAHKFFGPDFAHFGMVLLIGGLFLTFSFRSEQELNIAEQSVFSILKDTELHVDRIEVLKYENGAVKDWYVYFSGFERPLEVNKPLRISGVKIYLKEFYYESVAGLCKGDDLYFLSAASMFPIGNVKYEFLGLDEQNRAIFQTDEGQLTIAIGDFLEDYLLEYAFFGPMAVISAVWDPGYSLFIAGFVMIALGFLIYFIEKSGLIAKFRKRKE